jgi:hypothetical protein
VGFFIYAINIFMTDKIVDSGAVTLLAPRTHNPLCDHTGPECACEIPSEEPVQTEAPYKWEYKERQSPKWGTVEREGLIVGRGKTRRVVPPDDVYKLGALGCTDREIADWFMIKEDTLRYNFADYLTKARSELKRRLRASQIKYAQAGNAALLIWLGKNLLGQSDNPTDSEANKPLPWSDGDL